MVFDLKSLSRIHNFDFDSKVLGSVRCGSVSYSNKSTLAKMLELPKVSSLEFARQLLHLLCKKTVAFSGQEVCLTDEEINLITDEEIETFSLKFIAHNGWLLESYKDGERQVRTNEKGETIVSFTPKIIDLPREEAERSNDYLVHLFRHFFTRESAQLKITANKAKHQLIQDRFWDANRYLTENSAISTMERIIKREQELMQINDPFRNAINQVDLVSKAIASQHQHEQDLIWKATRQAEDTRRHFEEVTQSLTLSKAIYHNESLTRDFALRTAQMEAISAANIVNDIKKQQLETCELIKRHEMMFRLPQTFEMAHLLNNYEGGVVAKFAPQHGALISDMQRTLQTITTPWLHRIEAERSVSAILELQGIGNALKTVNGFDPEFTMALRHDLGDWRDKITFPEAVFIDPVARNDFYIDRGFNSALTDFPEAAFHEVLKIAGLDDASLDLKLFGLVKLRSANPEEEAGLQRTNKCHDLLQRFERLLRKFINEKMTTQYGLDWPKKRLAPKTYEEWKFKKEKAKKNGEILDYIEVADFTDYERIICRQDNWREVFQARFKRMESVRESLQRLQPIRVASMHARIITKEDELYLIAEIVRLQSAMKT